MGERGGGRERERGGGGGRERRIKKSDNQWGIY